jgi:hypothetical protein
VSLHNGLDIVSIATRGVFTETYDSVSNPKNVASLYASIGFLETAYEYVPPFSFFAWMKKKFNWFWEIF